MCVCLQRHDLIKRFATLPEDRLLLGHLLDLADRADRRGVPAASRFLDPRRQALARALLEAARAPHVLFGGYEGAERRVAVVGAAPPEPPEPHCGIALMQADTATGGLTHRDYLGALMGLGIARELIGDILVQERGAQLLVCDSCASFLEQNLLAAGRARLALQRLALGALQPVEQQAEELRITVASARLDAVLAAVYPMSRGAAAELIAAGRVSVSSMVCQKQDRLLKEGDTVTLRGRGRLEVVAFGGTTRKGRTVLTVRRFGR